MGESKVKPLEEARYLFQVSSCFESKKTNKTNLHFSFHFSLCERKDVIREARRHVAWSDEISSRLNIPANRTIHTTHTFNLQPFTHQTRD